MVPETKYILIITDTISHMNIRTLLKIDFFSFLIVLKHLISLRI